MQRSGRLKCLVGLGVAALLGLACGACTFHRVYLSVEPEPFEGQFVRACELLESPAAESTGDKALRPQPDTMAALSAIRPPGRFCFVCRRLRRCTARLQSLGVRDPQARSVAETAVAHLPASPRLPPDLPPAGGPGMEAVQSRICRACASMPKRIQDGTWVPTSQVPPE